MMKGSILTAGMIAASLAFSTAASAQLWGPPPPPPPPPPPYGFLPPPPPPPGPPPLPAPRVVEKWAWGQPGYKFYRPHCWIEYRNGGWEMVKVCQ